jgi:hypothetical protein
MHNSDKAKYCLQENSAPASFNRFHHDEDLLSMSICTAIVLGKVQIVNHNQDGVNVKETGREVIRKELAAN